MNQFREQTKRIAAKKDGKCPECKGRGHHVERAMTASGIMHGEFRCIDCNGTGQLTTDDRS